MCILYIFDYIIVLNITIYIVYNCSKSYPMQRHALHMRDPRCRTSLRGVWGRAFMIILRWFVSILSVFNCTMLASNAKLRSVTVPTKFSFLDHGEETIMVSRLCLRISSLIIWSKYEMSIVCTDSFLEFCIQSPGLTSVQESGCSQEMHEGSLVFLSFHTTFFSSGVVVSVYHNRFEAILN